MGKAQGRWCRKDRRIYDFSTCLYCGSGHGVCKGETRAHTVTTCMACGTPQCMGNGLSRGTCGICLIGLLPGWAGNDRKCSYQGCNEKAIARADGQNKFRCRNHLERGKWEGYVAARLAEREKGWEPVPEMEVPIL